jgi:hypothetical protein
MSIVLFGAFDRHNFGDLLLPHVAAALLPGREWVCAGLAQRDLRPYGGHAVQALADLAAAPGQRHAALVHVGGEILTCSAWQAAVMLLPPAQAQATLAYLQTRPREQRQWVRRMLGTAALAPYTAARQRLPGVGRVIHAGVGGVALANCEPALRAEVISALRTADHVGVRDRLTLEQLCAAGIPARLMPDPAVMVADLFDPQIQQRANQGEVAAVRNRFPRGYLALQFSAEFGDDDTLARLSAQVEGAAAAAGLGVVLFRAGAAPWHDDLDALRRMAARLPPAQVHVFNSLDLWSLCALIAHSRGYCGSSLHGRIVAMAFARPRVTLRWPGPAAEATPVDKPAAFAATWDLPEVPRSVEPGAAALGIVQALAADPARLQARAKDLVREGRQGFQAIRQLLS